MSFIHKYRLWIAGAIVVIAGVWLIYAGYQTFKPLPTSTEFNTRFFSFKYPRIYHAQEYAPGVVSIGNQVGEGLVPLVEVTRYQSDPDSKVPTTFDAFMKKQASALCGADGSTESITCTEVGVSPYTSPKGFVGQKLDLTLVRKNLKTGTTTSSTYGPFYVFNTTSSDAPTPDDPLRYSSIFIHPSLSSFLDLATTSPEIMNEVMNSFILVQQ